MKVPHSIRKVVHVDPAPERTHAVRLHLQSGRNIGSIPILFHPGKWLTIHGKGCLSEPTRGSDGPTSDLQLIGDGDLVDVPASFLTQASTECLVKEGVDVWAGMDRDMRFGYCTRGMLSRPRTLGGFGTGVGPAHSFPQSTVQIPQDVHGIPQSSLWTDPSPPVLGSHSRDWDLR